MYQFMIVTTGSGSSFADNGTRNVNTASASYGGEIPAMSFSSGTNKWASRAVVALQLAAWSAVGIVLLEKGVTSLRRKNLASDLSSLADNASIKQVALTGSANLNESIVGVADTSSVLPLEQLDVFKAATTATPSTMAHDYSSASRATNSMRNESSEVAMGKGEEKTIYNDTRTHQESTIAQSESFEGRREPNGETINSIFQSAKKGAWSGSDRSKDSEEPKVGVAPAGNVTREDTTRIIEGHGSTKSDASTKNLTGASSNWPTTSRTRSRLARINTSSGAAAAVAMIAVGAVMLVLGPAVIVLRALDERRQERRFLKLSGEEDLPPSYEQATRNIEPAPTYSSLNLDAISSPPSPTRASNNSAFII